MILSTAEAEPYLCPECWAVIEYEALPFGDKWLLRRDECECEKKRRADEERRYTHDLTRRVLKADSGVSGEWAKQTFETLENRAELHKATKAASAFVFDFPHHETLILSGEPGVGKTHIASAVANALLDRLVRVKMLSLRMMLDTAMAAIGAQEGENGLLVLDGVQVVILDEMGEGKASEWAQSKVFGIVDLCYRSGVAMVVTTNLRTMNDLAAKVGKRTMDRLLHRGRWIDIDAESYRIQKFKERAHDVQV